MHNAHISHGLSQILNVIHSPYQINPTLYYHSIVGKVHAIHGMAYTHVVYIFTLQNK